LSENKNQNFITGAVIIALSHIIVKVIGALFRIPLANLIDAYGMGIYQSAYNIYLLFFAISTAGIPVAISKLIAEYNAKGKIKEAGGVLKVSTVLLFAVGAVGTLVLILGAGLFSHMLGVDGARLCIIALAPSLFFVCISSVYRGYFQGEQNMLPTALSEVIEAIFKLFVGLAAAGLFIRYGADKAAAGGILGVTTGALFSAVFLLFYYKFKKKNKPSSPALEKSELKEILKRLVVIAVPITIGSSVFTLTSSIDTVMVLRRLQAIGFDEKTATEMFGYYSGYAITLFNLPSTVIVGLSISVVPAVAAALARGEVKEGAEITASSTRITWQLAFPAGLGMAALASPILKFLFPTADFVIPVAPEGVSVSSGILSVLNSGGDATKLLTMLGLAISLVCITMLTNSILQALGKVWLPVINMFIGGVVKIIANYVLVGIPGLNIMGAPISTTLCYFLVTVLNLMAINKVMKPRYGIGATLIKPAVSVIAMGIGASIIYSLCAESLGNTLSIGVSICIAVLVYFALMLILKGFKKTDIALLPKGEKLAGLAGKFLS